MSSSAVHTDSGWALLLPPPFFVADVPIFFLALLALSFLSKFRRHAMRVCTSGFAWYLLAVGEKLLLTWGARSRKICRLIAFSPFCVFV